MSFEFVMAKELDEEFEVHGRFYNVRHRNSVFECRNQVHINRKNITAKKPDAIIVMVNPGSSEPQNRTYNVPFVKPGEISDVPFTPARTDDTQRQIMRLMKMRNWNSVLIINLSDLRCGNLEGFKKLLKSANQCSFHSHSIFSKEREEELTNLLHSCSGSIILGWGTNPIIRDLAKTTLDRLTKFQPTGYKYHIHPYYYHPSPLLKEGKIRWLLKWNKYSLRAMMVMLFLNSRNLPRFTVAGSKH